MRVPRLRAVFFRGLPTFFCFTSLADSWLCISAFACHAMAKRISGSNDGSPHAKRQRITRDSLPPLPKEKPVKIHNVRDLQVLLAFDQTTGPHVRQSMSLSGRVVRATTKSET